ncbi:MAG: type I methionyl aminopeptidase [Syntrophorhabdaceae bacterium]|nr:type I methionyl aminopeptidase [Syntrophorhabdales bacterium]MBP9560674.1 type I methionyl aminopeptidase [Syntrophorhabdaceae bacterium]
MIIIKTPAEIEKIRIASIYAMEMLLYLKDYIKEGIKTIELEMVCEDKIRYNKKIKAAFKGYNGYPFCLCVSVNDEVVHGMPSERILRRGDIVSIDFGVQYDGFYGDAALTEAVGTISDEAARLLKVTEESLYKGIEQTKEGNRLNDISNAVQIHAERAGFSVVREFVGHGIGASLHEDPQVPNYGEKGKGIRLKKGMVFAIEPMINAGRSEVMIKENGWTVVTRDGSLSAHFEHTVAITEKGPEILSRL